MQQEKDYFQREIQRLSLLLTKLIGMATGLKSDDLEQSIQNIESDLKNEFDLTLRGIEEMEDQELIDKLNGMNEQHSENLAELIHNLINNKHTNFGSELAKKGIVILDFLDNNSKTFSLKRMELKNTLQQRI